MAIAHTSYQGQTMIYESSYLNENSNKGWYNLSVDKTEMKVYVVVVYY